MRENLSVWGLLARSTVYRLLAVLLLMCAAEAALAVCLAGALACFLILGTALSRRGERYTLERLRVSEWTVVLWQCLHNGLCFLILWGVQAAALYLLMLWYSGVYPERVGSPGLLLAVYRSPFLLAFLPLSMPVRYLLNLSCAAGMGIVAAAGSLKDRHGKRAFFPEIAAVVAVFSYFGGIHSLSADMGVLGIILAVIAIRLSGAASTAHHGGMPKEGWDE